MYMYLQSTCMVDNIPRGLTPFSRLAVEKGPPAEPLILESGPTHTRQKTEGFLSRLFDSFYNL